MPAKRAILENLRHAELLEVVDNYGLETTDRRAKDGLVEAVASSRKATIIEILGSFKRDRLKELCRMFSLDDAGREKQVLIERLVGSVPTERASFPETDKRSMFEKGKISSAKEEFSLELTDAAPSKRKRTRTKSIASKKQDHVGEEVSRSIPPTRRSSSANPPLFGAAFLAARWEDEYRQFQVSGHEKQLLGKLQAWHQREVLSETASEAAFIKQFFQGTWGYSLQGDNSDGSYECYPQFAVSRAGQTGGTGQADLALGYFSQGTEDPKIPQVLCEFKDIKSGLDQPQHRKGNARSPVRQAFDYLREAANDLSGHELVEPSWAIVTDMREFRLYNRIRGLTQCQSFTIDETSLLAEGEAASFNRFLFWKIFSKELLLSKRGPSFLERHLKDQLLEESGIEKDFYLEYKNFREFVYKSIVAANPDFKGTKGQLVRLTQRLLDRCLFVLFCEDMGVALDFPPDLLRDVLIRYSTDPFYNENDTMPWERMKIMFSAMRDGGMFGEHQINRFNGGLFEPLPELENLKIPAKVFCTKNQAAGGMKAILNEPQTLLYLSAKYNFGIKDAAHERMIDFYALGRIFEQSITELEIMEAEAEGRESINLLTKRKRNGVYYTPEWVTAYIVEETVGARLAEIKERLGIGPENLPNDADVLEYRAFLNDRRRTAKVAGRWLDGLKEYRVILNRFSVVDPACGSGAFLIQALEYLKKERQWIAEEQERISGARELWDWDEVVKDILANNIYGVDINPESVEIAKLALWMHTATRGKPLSSLDHNIQCGNSLVGPDFYKNRERDLFSEEEQEKINVFDWHDTFKNVFSRGGFDCVIGNPPYVKFQHFKRVQNDVAEYLISAQNDDGSTKYESVQIGNFDLYLPFIERGLDLLKPDGKMGFIAPNVWLMNDYGEGLRKKLKRRQQLDRWVDFQDYQVFEEAITYTALQFFSGSKIGTIQYVRCPGGDISNVNWNSPIAQLTYDEIGDGTQWQFIPDEERFFSKKLFVNCKTLEECSKNGLVGIRGVESGADEFFCLQRISEDQYLGIKNGAKKDMKGVTIEIEDELMKPLISGSDATRYSKPLTSTYFLFPYDVSQARPRLFSISEMENRFPKAWKYLLMHESELRGRESGKMDKDDKWWGYVYPKNLEKQKEAKLGVPQTVTRLSVFFDSLGEFCFNNVRVGGIIPQDMTTGYYLLGVLNSPVPNWFFRRIARPKEGGFFEANKQFISPLPIPFASDTDKKAVVERAKSLQNLHTNRRDLIAKLERRISSTQCEDDKRTEKWLWANLKTPTEWKKSKETPDGLNGRALNQWAREQAESQLQHHLDGLDMLLKSGANLTVDNTEDEISFSINGKIMLTVFDEPGSEFIAAQWRHIARSTNVTEKYTGKRLVTALLKLRKTDNANLAAGVVKLDNEIQSLDGQIESAEREINQLIYKLYDLTEDEIRLVENG